MPDKPKKTKVKYVEAIDRLDYGKAAVSHLYVVATIKDPKTGFSNDSYTPMCIYGWNRNDGESFSILRGHSGKRGLCRVCQRRRNLGLPGVEARPNSHRTRSI